MRDAEIAGPVRWWRMQLYLTREELELVKRMFREKHRCSCSEAPSTSELLARSFLGGKLLIGRDLARAPLSQNLALDYEELESFAAFLRFCEEELMRRCESKNTESDSALAREVAVIRHLLEKVAEVSAVL